MGADQAEAVRGLCAGGPAIRTLIAPAGFGKTTTVHAAAVAAVRAGKPVRGLVATHQAAGELRQAGIPALTIARFALDGAAVPPGTVVILDEVSQVATVDAEVVLAAVSASPGAQLWCLGDPHQAQSVRAGGLGAELARLGAQGRIPAAQLTENRRQLHPAEREALAHYRAGHVAVSQAIRHRHGWEHDLGSPHATREALADAVVADIAAHGPSAVVALAVAHVDCEDLADRVRARLRAAGRITGPELAGPAWVNGARGYAAGDRILVHGTLRTDGQRFHNGAVLTVTAVDNVGLSAADDRGDTVLLPQAFVAGRRTDGSPNLSHAWARTVDGIQGGTWAQVHLLGTAALERFTGYTGQSRSRCATHTWNVTRHPEIDFGGVLADQRTPTAKSSTPSSGYPIPASPPTTIRNASSGCSPNTKSSWPAPRPTVAENCAKPRSNSAPPTRSKARPSIALTPPKIGSPASAPCHCYAATAGKRRTPLSRTSNVSAATSIAPPRASLPASKTATSAAARSTSMSPGAASTTGATHASPPSTRNWPT
ncbi:MAG: AAA family ATPase [Acidimicrobiia bacterium]